MMITMRKILGKSIFKATGWEYNVDPTILEKKQVIIGFEHSSNLDTILSLALFEILELKIHTLIKKELFKGPLKPVLKRLGGIAVDRKASKDIVTQMVDLFNQNDSFNLVIAPEATRAKSSQERKPIRTGFWHIAKAANVPIILMYANPRTKQGGILGKIYPTDLQQDLEQIKALYAEYGIDVKTS
ncbi:1-acyl-sn-glycerol-3-phosphate acyltransferase [Acinetobacter sp. NIPH 2699]|uniref:1-acyl-sn-glycerol-3-phosphate acyltransferase n=1 Tax=Acinetobacter sp. NIPH 2699 TaxID=2923433 RepID=UPI001F4B99BA|nr:1-acyl-sn-glycerol-3-phosphate acyltransferase [Acinetobacter sp. NIPH 2699]MCH7336804.1 1-acyl-sn-glycerol-3-phosphate acyltransferase [Acinetobacter sp. NIPH 2699]